ncbi:MAG: tryptophan-rich sensory protein [Bacillota bacterium]
MELVLVKGFVILSFVFMMSMNVYANTKPLHGNTTSEISNKYPTLFTPSGFTFSIWGVIYLFLIFFTSVFVIDSSQFSNPILTGLMFGVSSVLNGIWLNFWHQDKQVASSVIMFILLMSLIYVYLLIQDSRFYITLPIRVYLGWIAVATLAQISVLLYPYKPSSYKIEVGIFFLVLIVGVALAIAMNFIYNDWVFALVIIWGYFGIYAKHKSQNHLWIKQMVLVCIGIILLLSVISIIV